MSDTETIKEFLVKLGFKVDASGEKKFNNTIAEITKSMSALGLAVDVSLAAVVAFTAKAGEALDKLYFASQRTGSTVDDINSMAYAIGQLGGSGEGAKASLENLGHFIRSYPGSASFLEKLGVSPEHVTNAEKALEDLSRTFKSMPFWQAQPYANMLGIDEKTLIAMQDGSLNKYLDDYRKRLSDIGLSEQDAAKGGNEFMTAMRGLGAEAQIAGELLMNGWLGKSLTWIVEKLDAVAKGVGMVFGHPAQAIGNIGTALQGAGVSAYSGQSGWAKTFEHFVAQGWSANQAAGIAGNLSRESGFNPSAVGDNGQAYGIGQWHKDRRADFKKYAGHDIFGSSLEEQLGFIDYEMKNKEWKAGAQLRDAKAASEAGARFSEYYERPADRLGEARLRGGLAEKGLATVTQNTTIQVTGNDPNAIATAVAARQNDVNNALVRNVQGAVR